MVLTVVSEPCLQPFKAEITYKVQKWNMLNADHLQKGLLSENESYNFPKEQNLVATRDIFHKTAESTHLISYPLISHLV